MKNVIIYRDGKPWLCVGDYWFIHHTSPEQANFFIDFISKEAKNHYLELYDVQTGIKLKTEGKIK